MPPAGTSTPPTEAATWFATLLIRLALTAATASNLEQGSSRETTSRWIEKVLGPPPTPALLRATDPGRIDHTEAVNAAADHTRCHEYTVDLVRIGLTDPNQEPDQRGIDAHCTVTNDKTTRITVIAMLGRLTAMSAAQA